jgi:hypothetical protein
MAYLRHVLQYFGIGIVIYCYNILNISSELKRACPEGIDLYFDNVGGKHLEAAIDNMKTLGRILLCGMVSQYSAYALPNLFQAIPNRLRLHGFIVRDHNDTMLNEFHSSMIKWINEGKINLKETITEGLENAPNAFIGLFKGENFGKMLVNLGFALACDIRIASSNAKIGQTEVTIGIPPGWRGTQRLVRIVGPAKTEDLIYTGKMITAEEAERIGLVNRVIGLSIEEERRSLPAKRTTVTTVSTPTASSDEQQQQEKQK